MTTDQDNFGQQVKTLVKVVANVGAAFTSAEKAHWIERLSQAAAQDTKSAWAPETQVRDILFALIREHDRQGTTGISGADLADYTARILKAAR